jgi:hypothetical protein
MKGIIYPKQVGLLRYAFVLLVLSLPILAHATRYTTLADGNYYNVTNVWATDGVTPCFCSPSDTLVGGDTLEVTSQILLGSNLTLRSGAVLNIYLTGSVYGNYSLVLDGAVVSNEGILSVAELTQLGFGNLVSLGTLNINPGDLVIESGQFQMGVSNHVGGSLVVAQSAYLQVLENGILVVDGNYSNQGISNLQSGACVTVLGDFSNIYVVFGAGHIGAQGSMTNDGDWGGITWCAGGADSGLPGIEDCNTCGPLPVALGEFKAVFDPGLSAAVLKWNTLLESNSDAFLLARSTDGQAFEPLTEVASTAPNGGGAAYAHTDLDAPQGDVWYQLSQRDQEGNVRLLATQRVRISDGEVAPFSAWPNPFGNLLHFGLGGDEVISVNLRDLNGRLLLTQDHIGGGEIDGSALPAGIYLLEYQTADESGFVRVSKQ